MHTAGSLRILAVLVSLAAVLRAAPSALASGPAAEVTMQLDRVVGILQDPALQGEGQRERRRLAVRRVQ